MASTLQMASDSRDRFNPDGRRGDYVSAADR